MQFNMFNQLNKSTKWNYCSSHFVKVDEPNQWFNSVYDFEINDENIKT